MNEIKNLSNDIRIQQRVGRLCIALSLSSIGIVEARCSGFEVMCWLRYSASNIMRLCCIPSFDLSAFAFVQVQYVQLTCK